MVLDYFALSPFWDRQCNNQVLSMQTQYNDLRQPYEATVEALRLEFFFFFLYKACFFFKLIVMGTS